MTDHVAIARNAIEAWNTHSSEQVLSCYTTDLVYKDPNTRGEIRGAQVFGRYLEKMFTLWEMHWQVEAVHPFRDTDGAAALWTATLRLRAGGEATRISGMDLALVSDGKLSRNEVYFDRTPLSRGL